MHLAKGLEFRAVVVVACDDEIIPLQERIEAVGDDADLQEVYDTERRPFVPDSVMTTLMASPTALQRRVHSFSLRPAHSRFLVRRPTCGLNSSHIASVILSPWSKRIGRCCA